MTADGYSLDDKRQKIEKDDIPDVIARWKSRKEGAERKRTDKSFQVPVKEIRYNGFDLSINKYKEVIYEHVIYAY